MPTLREVTCTASELVLLLAEWANSKSCNRYCITVSAVAGKVGPTVKYVTGTASQLVLLLAQGEPTVREVTCTASELVLLLAQLCQL